MLDKCQGIIVFRIYVCACAYVSVGVFVCVFVCIYELQHRLTFYYGIYQDMIVFRYMCHTATHCNTLQHTATHSMIVFVKI